MPLTYKEAIQAYGVAAEQYQARIAAGIKGVADDVAAQNALIKQLQDNPGPISTEDQAILDKAEAAGVELASKLEALDAETPPVVPPAQPS
jgi:hypothetical protein